jgi:hypothetical protein
MTAAIAIAVGAAAILGVMAMFALITFWVNTITRDEARDDD